MNARGWGRSMALTLAATMAFAAKPVTRQKTTPSSTPVLDAPKRLSLTPPAAALPAPRAAHGTACGSCHATRSWKEVRFNHAATGFMLNGQHAQVGCRQCHVTDFTQGVPRGCSGCHADPHAGDLGQRCESCHDERSWQSEFSVESHRRTNFPLLGGHAVLPCVECHVENRERRVSRPAVPCVSCHQADVARTAGTVVDHQRLALSDACASCHSGIRFTPARLVDHDACFFLSGGAHASISCAQCHANGVAQSMGWACTSRTATCTSCHTHQCSGPQGTLETDRIHEQVQGYQCRDAKCSECHDLGAKSP